jgi:hypothetical protein
MLKIDPGVLKISVALMTVLDFFCDSRQNYQQNIPLQGQQHGELQTCSDVIIWKKGRKSNGIEKEGFILYLELTE